MHTRELQYDLPPELIAQHPADRRDASRLLCWSCGGGSDQHHRFADLPELLPPRSLLVLNDTRVLPARLRLHRRTGGRVEALFLREPVRGTWEVMVTGAGRLKAGETLMVDRAEQNLRLLERVEAGVWRVEPIPAGDAAAILSEIGTPPLPPYIRRTGNESADARSSDLERYQTVYARRPGAVAAPTAGLHFTSELMDRLAAAGFETVTVTLHVGAGTFAPIRCDDLADHKMHAEWYECLPATAEIINRARDENRTVVAVGTTSVRVLETCADETGGVRAGSGWTELFIYPPYQFKVVKAMLTNFHLPGSTLLAMLFAFAGRENILAAYQEAIRQCYRFYSYGDAMLIA